MKLSRFPRKPLVIAMMALPAAAFAADADTPQAPEQQLSEVVVTAAATPSYKAEKASSPKLTQSLKDTPRTISVVPESVIKDRGATTLGEVLRSVSGISMAAGEGGTPAGDNLTVRGFSARTDIFVDGVRDIGGYTRDPFNLGSVEVSKGPSSSLTGRGSTGGSVNLVSKLPEREDFTSGSTGIGTDSYVRQTFDINRVISDTAAARLNLMYQDNDVPGRDNVENRRLGVAPSLQLGQGTDTRTTLSLLHLEGDNTPDYGIPFLRTNTTANGQAGSPSPVPYDTWYGLNDKRYNRDRTTTDMVTLLVEHDINENQSVRQAFRYGHNDRDSM
ncbi:MAG: TonB-dependent receptor plug domain-containing protein, partial [Perlucidibaca sp.]